MDCTCKVQVGRPKKAKRGPKVALPAVVPVEELGEEEMVVEEPEGPFVGIFEPKSFELDFGDFELDESEYREQLMDIWCPLDGSGGISQRLEKISKFKYNDNFSLTFF